MKIKYSISIYVLLFFVLDVFGQEPFMYHYTVKDGLPSNEVHFIYEDSKNYIWICTDAGIAKYNANNFKIFDSSEGLEDNTVFEVFEDKNKKIWYRTLSGGIGYLFNDSIYHIPANKKIIELQGKGLITSFLMDDKGCIILGRSGLDQCYFIKVSPPYKENNVEKITSKLIPSVGVDGILYNEKVVFSENRIMKDIDAKNKDLHPYYKIILHDPNGKIIFSDSILRFNTNALSKFFVSGNTIIYTNRGNMIKHDLKKITTFKLNTNFTFLYPFVDSNIVMLGCRSYGVFFPTIENNNAQQNYLTGEKSVTCIKKDSYGGFWYSTLEDGIWYSPETNNYKIKVFEESVEANSIIFFKKTADSSFIIVTRSGEIYATTLKEKKIEKKLIYKIKDPNINTNFSDIDETRFFMVINDKPFGSLVEIKNGTSVTVRSYPYFYKKIIPIRNKYLAMFTKQISIIDPRTLNREKEFEFNDRISAIGFDPKTDSVYVGSLHGLYSFKLPQPNERHFSLSNIRIEDLLLEKQHLFISTKSNGLIVKTGMNYDTILMKQGLLSNSCGKFFIINDQIWILTGRGFSCVNYKSHKNYSIKNYPFSSLMFPESVSQITNIGESILFFNQTELHVRSIQQKESKKPVRVSYLTMNNKLIFEFNDLDFSYNENNIAINFEALFFENNKSVEYRYKLLGADTNWKYTTKAEINFSSMFPGDYAVNIQAKTILNKWVDCENIIKFRIQKPFWQTLWFILILSLLFAGLVGLIIFERYKRILKKEREGHLLSSKLHELEMKSIRAQMNPHFIFNSLNTVQQFIMTNENEKAEVYLTKFSKLMRQLLESNIDESISIEEEADILLRYMEIESMRFTKLFEYKVTIDEKINTLETTIPLFMIQPFIENSIWHGLLPKKNNRKLEVRFDHRDERTIICTIDDNGVGRTESGKKQETYKKRSLALSFVTQRLELFSKTMNLECGVEIIDKINGNGDAEGTKVIIILPLLNA